jgi:hypothetical protein
VVISCGFHNDMTDRLMEHAGVNCCFLDCQFCSLDDHRLCSKQVRGVFVADTVESIVGTENGVAAVLNCFVVVAKLGVDDMAVVVGGDHLPLGLVRQ